MQGTQRLSHVEWCAALLPCRWDYVCPEGGCGGCWGGWVEPALQYVSEHGIDLEARYPYLGQNGMCR